MKERLYYIDRLRTVLTILVIFHHTSITFGGEGSWYYVEVTGDELTPTKAMLSLFTGVNQAFFMGFFFLISGYFTPGAYVRKGPMRFLANRFIRLGIPLIVYLAVIGPGMVYALNFADTTSLWSFYKEWVLTLKLLDFGPLWFGEALLYFSIIYVVYGWIRKESKEKSEVRKFPSHTMILISAVVVGMAAFVIRLVFPTGTDVLGLQFGYFASYILLFVVGIIAYRNKWLEQLSARIARRWLWVSLAVLPALPIAAIIDGGSLSGGANPIAFIYALWEPFVAYGIIMVLLVWFRERFNRASRLFHWLSDNAFTVYIIHPPIVVGISLMLKQFAWPAGLKFLVVGLLATVCCFAASALIRFIPGTRRVL
ncbi:acyltransferase family protein [Paenibacillus spongiae]|uniref:Acyltransferase family protein n=1 Tax=Paenibacillus spongiae TaxID=2909671 RepID=A0ABY5S887_9BACL|nr:acyltransferase family protein [Paenibacillus spongiae]UVI29037.1 acyltransferase family protein [Paenibacillus spongiae]